jgi:hypothetical protein
MGLSVEGEKSARKMLDDEMSHRKARGLPIYFWRSGFAFRNGVTIEIGPHSFESGPKPKRVIDRVILKRYSTIS